MVGGIDGSLRQELLSAPALDQGDNVVMFERIVASQRLEGGAGRGHVKERCSSLHFGSCRSKT